MVTKRITLAFIENARGQILLTKRSDNERIRSGEWYIPGGHCKENESFLDCLNRELKEELGINVKKIIDQVEPIFKKAHDQKYEIKIFKLYIEDNKFVIDKNEISEVMWINPKRMSAYVVSKSIPEYYSLLKA